ncbi:MAG: type II secretion system F family protein [Candidatus Aenigmarchaeota archaeon]|nr:type II secretion system F family protein [Candidatus Aenigmarchaeota archaeon]
MGFYTRLAMSLFGQWSEIIAPYFSEIKSDLKSARLRTSLQEYISTAILTSFLIFGFEFPLLSFIFALLGQGFLFSFIFSFTLSIFVTLTFFHARMAYPKVLIRERAKKLDNALPFASLYLSTIAGSKLPVYRTFEIFSKYSKYGEITEEISRITGDVESFGMDINTALERAIERTPSKKFKEMLWGVLSISRTGGDLNAFLKERARGFAIEYRRKLYEFSHQLTMFIEIYLTAIILGAIFFVTLTSVMSGIAGTGGNVLILQFFLIFFFLPLVSLAFIALIRSIAPGGE